LTKNTIFFSLIYIRLLMKSEYSHDDRKHIRSLIENLKNVKDYEKIFEILTADDSNSYTHNSNGVFLNLSSVSDKTLNRVYRYLKKINKRTSSTEEVDDFNIIPSENENEKAYKLSNYEKNILKQRNLKKALGKSDYEELRFTPKKKLKKEKLNNLK
jgi:CRISPR/Cas system CMR subunit Cmr4 (Cas7 group RAMP superfamily)